MHAGCGGMQAEGRDCDGGTAVWMDRRDQRGWGPALGAAKGRSSSASAPSSMVSAARTKCTATSSEWSPARMAELVAVANQLNTCRRLRRPARV